MKKRKPGVAKGTRRGKYINHRVEGKMRSCPFIGEVGAHYSECCPARDRDHVACSVLGCGSVSFFDDPFENSPSHSGWHRAVIYLRDDSGEDRIIHSESIWICPKHDIKKFLARHHIFDRVVFEWRSFG